ncbi:M48 family metalloprotease [Pseudobacteriovorax antillogorgiicola]|uniref:Peptidase family M48 n=1 Tax=Pseudobacteriovorax antillogorgiicola TaxID=1513793 RepID=A0A1Y6CTU8_9BACT|nr:M48 family metalloprotease [Pseudobacteriovorax antillogorgiicola]TCS45424.1 peptidase M48-like protein [Pseudobacteriovorax antillogorgiicola]SMF74162.1 Peptidase family M48 [Pseudobacteriovorax antillogorgiicola]
MKIFWTTLMAYILCVWSCSAKQSDRRVDISKQTKPDNQVDTVDEQTEEPASETRDEVTLPDFAFSMDEVKSLGPIFEEQLSESLEESDDGQFQDVELRIEGLINRALEAPDLQPGRQMKVVIQENDFPGANTLINILTIRSATLSSNFDNKSRLAVLCHEIGHTARNHSDKYTDKVIESGGDPYNRFSQMPDFTSYQQATLSGTTYTHDSERYKKVIATWENFSKDLSEFKQRQEFEADIIGAAICGKMGMDAATYHASIITFLKKAYDIASGDSSSSSEPEDFQLELESQERVDLYYRTLFAIKSHPSNEERDLQLKEVESALDGYWDADAPFYEEFLDLDIDI